jgi:hypothetical protein
MTMRFEIHSAKQALMPLSTETETVNKMDYETRLKELKEKSNYFKAKEGEQIVVPTTELDMPKEETINGKASMKADIKVRLQDNTEKIWSISVGGATSNYGKLMAIGQMHISRFSTFCHNLEFVQKHEH